MNITSSPQQPVLLLTDETVLLPSVSPPPPPPPPSSTSNSTSSSTSSITRSSIAASRIKSGPGGMDMDSNKLSMIKRSHAISNIQDLAEDSPVTFEIEPNEHFHVWRKGHSTSTQTISESISSIDKPQTYSRSGGREDEEDESDTHSACSEKSSEQSPEYFEEEKPILSGVHVKAATLNQLIRILIDSFREYYFLVE